MPFGPLVAKPGSSVKNLTGSWRLGKKPKFMQAACTACKLCYELCPEGSIIAKWLASGKAEKNTFQANLDYCKGCGICAQVCPKKGEVVMVEEKES
jgi:pyruvate ferredoxin oxidoreductase delta subunit